MSTEPQLFFEATPDAELSPYPFPQEPLIPPPPPPSSQHHRPKRLLLPLSSLLILGLTTGLLITRQSAQKSTYTPSPLVAYCHALEQHDYPHAYLTLSPATQQQVLVDEYLAGMQALDKLQGPITLCEMNAHFPIPLSSAAEVPLRITRAQHPTVQLLATLLPKQNGGWTIEHILEPLFFPLVTTTSYCSFLQQGEFTSAYTLLSQAGQTSFSSPTIYHDDVLQTQHVLGVLLTCTLQRVTQNTAQHTVSIGLGMSFVHFGNVPARIDIDMLSSSPSVQACFLFIGSLALPFPIPVDQLGTILGTSS